MGKAIVVGIVIVVALLIAAGVWIWTKRHDFKGDLSQSEERHMRELVSEAAMIFTATQTPRGYSVQDMDLLSPTTSEEIAKWMDKYNKNRREFERA
jgi:hypothetical protein